ncbi:MAG: MoaD/ThiS family protein [Ectothiorhodospiraceae bacterium]|nr:MoaD/ThiS family protein [Chromatiales bacterium]MCP5154213.1 MoaD/ThiS family protein [Ectothiorhodospiraceae bacterium]
MATVKVGLGGPLRSAAGGRSEFEVEASNVRQMLDALAAAEPRLAPVLARGVAVAIDGEIYRDDWFRAIPAGAEVFVLPRMAGG